MSGHNDLEVHYLLASMGSDVIPLAKCLHSFQCLQPHHITWGLHLSSVDAPVDVHGRNHNFPLIHPREVLLAGHWVTALPIFSCGIILVSPPVEVGLCGVGLVHLSQCMMDTYIQGNANLWCNKKSVLVEDVWPSTLVCHFIRGDICCNLMHHLPCILLPPILDLPLSLKSICLHQYQVTRFQVHSAYLSVIVPFLLVHFHHQLGLCLPEGSPQSVLNRSYIFVHTLGRGLSCRGLSAANGGEVKVNWEPRPSSKH